MNICVRAQIEVAGGWICHAVSFLARHINLETRGYVQLLAVQLLG